MSEQRAHESDQDKSKEASDWLSKKDQDQAREEFIKNNKEQFVDFLPQVLPDFSDNVIDQVGEYMARFFFGIRSVYRRYGFKYSEYELTYDTSDRNDYDGIAFHDLGNQYIIKISFFEKVAQILKDCGSVTISAAGIQEMIPFEDMMEITGVEEAAHYLYFNEKGDHGAGPLSDASDKLRYFTSDEESRALIWKLAYVRKYFPQYYDDLKDTWLKVREERKKARE
ncbi:MAG: hypothetical protein R6U52_01045 [Kosmotogaceae bacterium]